MLLCRTNPVQYLDEAKGFIKRAKERTNILPPVIIFVQNFDDQIYDCDNEDVDEAMKKLKTAFFATHDQDRELEQVTSSYAMA